MVFIWLGEETVVWGKRLAAVRDANAFEIGAVGARGQDPARTLRDNEAGIMGEIVGRLYLGPVSWTKFKRRGFGGEADFDGWIDAKTNQQPWRTNFMTVPPNAKPDRAYLMIYPCPHPCYLIVGWCMGEAAMRGGKDSPFWRSLKVGRPPAWNVPEHSPILREPEELRRIVRARHGW